MNERGKRKELTGMVISAKMQKTVIVETRRHVAHAKYRKIEVRRNKFAAHDEHSKAKVGDVVRIQETRPLSKNKRWRLIEVVKPATSAEAGAKS